MKLIFAATILLLSFSAFSETDEELIAQEKKLLNEIFEMKEAKIRTCYAVTQCPSGRIIQCATYGETCVWRTFPARAVTCDGFNKYGQWVNLWARCY